jgi:NAD(P)-dependent dehydrogenase (short-subunit alcohol dehydrogenase family)
MGRLSGKVAVITGAGSGMGRSMAQLFVAEGAKVVCADRSGAQDTVAASLGDAAIPVQVDVSVAAEVEAMVAAAEKKWGKLDVICNNAGFGGGLMPLADFSEEHYDRVVATNMKGVWLGMKYAILAMLRNGGGSVVNTASVAGMVGWRGHGVYGGAKSAVVQFTRCAALDYADKNIRVNAISPGIFWTGLSGQSEANPTPPPGARMPYEIPMGRWGLPEEIAKAALYFASDESSYVTGVIMPVDGGFATGPAAKPPGQFESRT